MAFLTIAGGLVILVLGAELLVRGSVGIARRAGLSALLIGLTLVGFGTSSPELVASITAALRGAPGIAVGNVVGSNICNVFLILGTAAVLSPLAISRTAFLRDGPVLIGATLLMLAVAHSAMVPRWAGAGLVALLIAYLWYCYRTERQPRTTTAREAAAVHAAEAASVAPVGLSMQASVVSTIGGLVLLVGGAALLVDGAIAAARALGIAETVIGLTVVAVGTSLPELATTVVAALRGQSDVAFGNVVGSCIYNVLGILGITALVQPIDIPPELAAFDIWVMLASAVCVVVFAATGWRLNRWEGALFLGIYALYIAHLAGVTLLPVG